jgi:hypothetical protein
MIFRPRQQAHPNPRLLYGEPDGPEALAHPAERIPCLSALTTLPSSPWPQFEAQRSKASTPTTPEESRYHTLEAFDAPSPLFEDADPIPLSVDDVGKEDENEESLEEEESLEILQNSGIMSPWDNEHRELVCVIDREKASDVRHWNQAKRRIPLAAFSGGASQRD